MKTVTAGTKKFLFFESLLAFSSLFHAVSTRIGGVSPPPFESLNLGRASGDTFENILANHASLSTALNFDLQGLISASQVHGTDVVCVDSIPEAKSPSVLQSSFARCDALVTNLPGITLIIRAADCVPILLFDPATRVLGLVHAGWKGTVGLIAARTIRLMTDRYKCEPRNIRAGIGPSIGPCCFIVQQDVADQFYRMTPGADRFIRHTGTQTAVDLWAANTSILVRQGCLRENIEVAGLCTACNSNLFFSHRGEKGKTGRFGLLAGLRF